jgi:hypothetical protein
MVANVVGTFYKWSFNGDDTVLNRIYISIDFLICTGKMFFSTDHYKENNNDNNRDS